MSDHEAFCAIESGYNWCTCTAYAEVVVARGFALYLDATGQVDCSRWQGHLFGSGPVGPGARCVRPGCGSVL